MNNTVDTVSDSPLEKAVFKQTINNVHHLELPQVLADEIQRQVQSYQKHILSPEKVDYAGIKFTPNNEVLYRGECHYRYKVDPKTRAFELTQGQFETEYGDLFALKALQADTAFGYGFCEALKRICRIDEQNQHVYAIRFDFMFKVQYTLELNKNRAYLGITLVDESLINEQLNLDERMLFELAGYLSYGFFAELNQLPNPLTEEEIFAKQKEYEVFTRNFVVNNSDIAKGERGQEERIYDVVTRDKQTGEIVDIELSPDAKKAQSQAQLNQINQFFHKLFKRGE